MRWRNLFIREIGGDEANRILGSKNEQGFKSVFNGKDFSGWAGETENYMVDKGAITCKPELGGTIFTEGQYGDFLVRLELQLPPGGNNGLAIRYPGEGHGTWDSFCELQVLDDGHLTDSKGRKVDFKNTVVIMTSNVASSKIMEAAGDREKAQAAVDAELLQAFRPEFINRIDDKIVFDPLTRGDMDFILTIQLKRVEKLLHARELKLVVTPEARTTVADLGFDPAFGARPLKRAITQYMMNPMAKAVVAGGYQAGDTIKVDIEGDNITFERIPGPPPETEEVHGLLPGPSSH